MVQSIKIMVSFHAPSAIILPNCAVVASTLRDISIALAAFPRLGLAGFYGIFMRLLHCFQKRSSQLCPLLGPSAALIIKAASACFYCSMPSLLRSLEQSYPDHDWFDGSTMVSVCTVQPSINLEFLCTNKNPKMSVHFI